MKNGFTLVELLVVISIIALLMGIMLPSFSRIREQAKIVAVNSELRQIAIGLELYMTDNSGKHPPCRQDCSRGWSDHQLPPELVKGGYLTAPAEGSGMSASIEDRFNSGCTYKYWSVGELYQNGRFMKRKRASLYVPQNFPFDRGSPETDIRYKDPEKSPVTWVIFSQGPKFDQWQTLEILRGPVAQRTWYNKHDRRGLLTRMRLRGKEYGHMGTFK